MKSLKPLLVIGLGLLILAPGTHAAPSFDGDASVADIIALANDAGATQMDGILYAGRKNAKSVGEIINLANASLYKRDDILVYGVRLANSVGDIVGLAQASQFKKDAIVGEGVHLAKSIDDCIWLSKAASSGGWCDMLCEGVRFVKTPAELQRLMNACRTSVGLVSGTDYRKRIMKAYERRRIFSRVLGWFGESGADR